MRRIDLAAEGLKEIWLQQVLFDNPDLLRMGEVDRAFADARPICMELLAEGGDGYRAIDILCLTPLGNIVVVEVKLGTSGEARRAVVAQALEYAGCLRRLRFKGIVARLRGLSPYTMSGAEAAGLDPDEFAAAVDDNLRRGRLLLLIALDRAGPALRGLVEDLRDLPAVPFEIALLEAACHEDEANPGSVLVTTRLAHTLRAIERPVVRPGSAPPRPEAVPPADPSGPRPTPMLETEFYEQLDRRLPGEGARLRAFVADLAAIGVRPDVVRTMTLRGEQEGGPAVSLATITPAGEMQIYPGTKAVIALPGGEAAVRAYLLDVARIIGGEPTADGAITGPPLSWHVTKDGRHPRIGTLLDNAQAWFAAIERMLQRMR